MLFALSWFFNFIFIQGNPTRAEFPKIQILSIKRAIQDSWQICVLSKQGSVLRFGTVLYGVTSENLNAHVARAELLTKWLH